MNKLVYTLPTAATVYGFKWAFRAREATVKNESFIWWSIVVARDAGTPEALQITANSLKLSRPVQNVIANGHGHTRYWNDTFSIPDTGGYGWAVENQEAWEDTSKSQRRLQKGDHVWLQVRKNGTATSIIRFSGILTLFIKT